MRQGLTRQPPVGSSAVRALSALGNGALSGTSRPSTPTPFISSGSAFTIPGIGGGDSNVLSQKISRLVADRQNVLQQSQRSSFNSEGIAKIMETSPNQNGKNDSWNEDQEVKTLTITFSSFIFAFFADNFLFLLCVAQVLEIVGSQGNLESYVEKQMESYNEESARSARAALARKVQRLRFHSQCQPSGSCPIILPLYKVINHAHFSFFKPSATRVG